MKNYKVFSKYGEIVLPPFIFMIDPIINMKRESIILGAYGLFELRKSRVK